MRRRLLLSTLGALLLASASGSQLLHGARHRRRRRRGSRRCWYHGGNWKVYVVSWNVAPYPLTSEEAILAAAAGTDPDITITRNAAADFLCPIQGP
jgi:hypothetical protein